MFLPHVLDWFEGLYLYNLLFDNLTTTINKRHCHKVSASFVTSKQ